MFALGKELCVLCSYKALFGTLSSTPLAVTIHWLGVTLPPSTGLQDDPDKMQEFYEELMSEQLEKLEEEEEEPEDEE